jgi:radical SAM protein
MLTPPHPIAGSRPSARDFATSPLLVFYELTRACDLVCLHCRACAQREPAGDELSIADSRGLIEQLASFPVPPLVVFTGGDPFKRRDLVDLASLGVQLGLEVAITPSATPLVTRAALEDLRQAGVARIAVSLDGPDADSHDRFRGVRGSYQRTLEIIRDAHDVGFPVQVNTTVTPVNRRRIDEFATLLDGFEIVLWSVFFLVPVGRATTQPRLTARQVEQAFEQLWRQSLRRRFAIKTTEAPHYRRFAAQRQKLTSTRMRPGSGGNYASLATNDGKGILFVGHNGVIHPSGFLPIPCGKFPHDNVVDVYQQAELFKALRDPDQLQGKCGVCKFRAVCGGSRARSYAVSGDPLAAEPDCVYLPDGWPPRDENAGDGTENRKLDVTLRPARTSTLRAPT